jgi:hypothetical protein
VTAIPEPSQAHAPDPSSDVTPAPIQVTVIPTPAPVPTSAPPSKGISSGGSQEDHAISDTTSIHSSQTLHSLSGPIYHPELPEPGLNASIIDVVSAWFSDGELTRSFVVGELALAYNPIGNSAAEKEFVRLNNFHVLEKVAANPRFVAETPNTPSLKGKEKETDDDDRRGEYTISLPHIARSVPTVAFKYQVHLDPSNLSAYCPAIFTPIWNLEEFQASVIILYSLNPSFTSSTPVTSIVLKNLVLTVNLDLTPEDEVTKQPRDVARATGAVMYPNTGATFRRKLSAVIWKIPELEITSEDGKFLARFATSTSWPRKGKVETKFDVRISDADAKLGISFLTAAAGEEHKGNDPFADENAGTATGGLKPPKTWQEIPTRRRLTAGRYICS